ncbi:MAG: helix-turn-helix domain-containing protein, partial [Gammaproteobacteria bacterium]|nr:helix-turn-helix domain-containing protein [Gammaproteobacteria bacterium]
MSTIGSRLRDKRRERGLNQKEIARAAEVTNAAVSKWETNGGNSMSAIVALNLADKLNVNPYWLIQGRGEPNERIHVPDISAEARDIASHVDRLPQDMRTA